MKVKPNMDYMNAFGLLARCLSLLILSGGTMLIVNNGSGEQCWLGYFGRQVNPGMIIDQYLYVEAI